MLALVDSLAPEPEHVALSGLGKVVDTTSAQLAVIEPLKSPGEHLGRQLELPADVVRVLGGVTGEERPFLSVHLGEARTFLDQGEIQAFALDEEDVSDMAGILERRPDLRSRSGANCEPEHGIAPVIGYPHSETTAERPQGTRHGAGPKGPIVELAFLAAVHLYIVADHQAVVAAVTRR